MNTLERALIEKAGCEHGWENIVESHETAVVLASARHRAHVRISANSTGCGWTIAVPEGLIYQELARSCPEIVERLVRQRIGQDIFRQALMDYWG